MRSDLFQDSKCIHVKIEKEVHAVLRSKLFKFGVSMQEAFSEFARVLAQEETSKATQIIESLINRKLMAACEGRPFKRGRRRSFGAFDNETLYSLINGTSDLEEDDK